MPQKPAQLIDLQPGGAVARTDRPGPTPVLPAAVGLMAGIIIQDLHPLGAWTCAGALCLAAFTVFSARARPGISTAMVVLAAASLGAIRYDLLVRRVAPDHIVLCTRDQPVLCHLRGEIVTPPEIVEPSPDVPRAYETDPRTRFVLEATGTRDANGWVTASGRVAVNIKAPVLLLRVGDRVEMTGWLYRPREPRNPGEFDRALADRRSGLFARFSCAHAESVRADPQPSGGWRRMLATMRRHLAGMLLHESLSEDEPQAGVIEAVVLGHRDAVSKAMNEAFVRTGNAHFLAASGMNVAWLAALGWGLMRLVGAHYRMSAIVMAFLILSYVLLAEPEPSIHRAGIMGLLGCLSLWLRGRSNVLNWLACSAVVVLFIDPGDLFRPGFQLSFLGVIGVMHVQRAVHEELAPRFLRTAERIGLGPYLVRYRLMNPYANSLIQPDHSIRGELVRAFCRFLALLCSVTIACWLVTAPLSCYTFGQLAPWGVLGTLILWIPAWIATVIGYLKLVVGLILPSSAALFGPLLTAATRSMVATVEFLSHLPGTLIDGRHPSLAWVLAAYTLIAWRTWRPEWLVFPHRFKIAALIIVLWWAIPPRWVTREPRVLTAWMLAVGDGSGTVIELPDGKVLIVDFGTRSPLSAGAVASAFLRDRGITRVDAIFLSHADFDHFSGIPAIASEFNVGKLVINDQFEPSIREEPAPKKLLHDMRQLGIPIEIVHGPATLTAMGDTTIEMLWPPANDLLAIKDDNNCSSVMKLRYLGRAILLTGDVAQQGIAGLLKRGDLHADVLALPHHGSVVANTGAFITAVDPSVCIRSSGQGRSMTRNGIERIVGQRTYFNTADDGCVKVRIARGELTAEPAMTRRIPSNR